MFHSAEADLLAKFVFLSLIENQAGISDKELLNKCCDSMYLDYFSYSQIKEEMITKGLALRSQRKNEHETDATGQVISRWDLTPSGFALLNTLRPSIPTAVLQFLHHSKRSTTNNEDEIRSFIEDEGNGFFFARLQIFEKSILQFELKLSFAQREQAEKMAQRWKKQASTLYPSFMELLAKDDA